MTDSAQIHAEQVERNQARFDTATYPGGARGAWPLDEPAHIDLPDEEQS